MDIKNLTGNFKSYLMVALIMTAIVVSSCSKDKDETGAVPEVTLSTTTAANMPGNMVSTEVNINAPEGVQALNIYKNGVLLSTETFSNEKTKTYTFEYTIESNFTTGNQINFNFEAVDGLNRKSQVKIFTVTVSEVPAKEVVEVPEGDVLANTVWTADKIWRLNGFVRVQDGITLTIEPGTVIFGARASKGTLIIQRGGKLIADGTSEHPIVFTSEREPGSREPGDWGGVVICGRAPNNQGTDVELEGGYGGIHGGNNPNDNSGILRYVRIEFAGVPIQPNQEINSLTLGSVGSGTTIENVQCSFGLDDSFEWFGGTVNARHIVAYRGLDDDFDTDFGYSGKVQFALGIRGATLADQSGSNGFESDNDGAGSSLAPFTQAIFANVTLIGPKKSPETAIQLQFQHAAQIRRNSSLSIYNSFMTGYPFGIFIDDAKPGSSQHALDGDLQIRNVVLSGVDNWGNNSWGGSSTVANAPLKQVDASVAPGFEINAWFNTATFKNQILTKWQNAGIDPAIFDLGGPVLIPVSGSMLLNAADWTNTPKADSFFEKTAYIGAFGSTNWTEGWCEWNPNAVDYRY
ncbi:MAG TPA: hypothetical protein VK172_06050 [Lentimicrobium sp.]|nr:hypothetical protein [Lentimicrobium sp.]